MLKLVAGFIHPGFALYAPDGETAAVPLLPKRALTLAKELLERGVQAIKADQWGAE